MNSNKDEPLVSIIMPTYNSAKTIIESINSVLSQTYSNWELLITDDNSDDETINTIAQFRDKRITIFKLLINSGAGAARNHSIENAQGNYIAFLDSDDLWRPEKLTLQISFMRDNNYWLTYSKYQTFDSTGKKGIVSPPQSTSYEELLYSNVIGCLTAIYDASKLGKQRMPLIRKRQDMGLWLQILKECDKAYCLNLVLADYRLGSGMTSNKLKVIYWQWLFYRKVANLSVPKTITTFIMYGIKGMLKQIQIRQSH